MIKITEPDENKSEKEAQLNQDSARKEVGGSTIERDSVEIDL